MAIINSWMKTHLDPLVAGTKNTVQKLFRTRNYAKRPMHSANQALACERRKGGLESFVLTLSDQQVVTGVAILIAGFIRTCSMSIYHFNIATSLAWFTSATHLATLGVLLTYFIDRPTVRDWRTIAMLLLLLMLIAAQLPAWSILDNSLPVSCFYSSVPIEPEFTNLVTLIATTGFLVVKYTERIARLYTWDAEWTISGFVIEILVRIFASDYRELSYNRIAKGGKDAHLAAREISELIRAEREKIRFRQFEMVMKVAHGRLKSYMLAILFMAHEFSLSFLSQVLTLAFAITYGFAQTIVFRLDMPSSGIEGDQNEMGFGQLVPLFLLLLPGLAIGELYFGECVL